jgi:hypothetical protein
MVQHRRVYFLHAAEVGSVKVVKDLSLEFFRSKLTKQFEFTFQRNEIPCPGKQNQIQQVHIQSKMRCSK